MEKFKRLIKNKWFKLGISLFGLFYTWFLCYACYIVFFYDISYSDRVKFALLYVLFTAASGFIYFYTRKSPITRILSLVNPVLLLPILLLDWGNLPLIVPAAILCFFGFFSSGINPTAKTIWGTIFLLFYIIGSVAFYFVWYVFRTTTEDTIIGTGPSPSGNFSYYILDIKNNSTGKLDVYMIPTHLNDSAFGCIDLDTTLKKQVRQAVKPAAVECEWVDDKLYINGELWFNEAKYYQDDEYVLDDGTWTYTYFEIDYPISTLIEQITDIAGKAVDKISEATED
ncbi:MAG: hypothetical protein LBL98_02040 [Ruminococcus sp.]|jgi:hypothetical protein|nr:hypothetical protein [Ruminococcus sp.]